MAGGGNRDVGFAFGFWRDVTFVSNFDDRRSWFENRDRTKIEPFVPLSLSENQDASFVPSIQKREGSGLSFQFDNFGQRWGRFCRRRRIGRLCKCRSDQTQADGGGLN